MIILIFLLISNFCIAQDFILFSGQSNVGANFIGTFPADTSIKYTGVQTNIKMLNPADSIYYQDIARIRNYQAGVNSSQMIGTSYAGSYWGLEASLLYEYADYFNVTVYCYKYGLSGNAILAWQVLGAQDLTFYANLYRIFSQAKRDGVNLTFKYFVWIQGESDGVGEALTNAYQWKFDTLHARIDRAYTRVCTSLSLVKNNDWKTIIFQIGSPSGMWNLSAFQTVQSAICDSAYNRAYLITTSDMYGAYYNADSLHYNPAGQIELGIRAFNKIVELE